MSNHDQATLMSLDYLSVLENRLKISWDSVSQPVCVFDRIEEGDINSLRSELDDLLNGSSGGAVRLATEQYGKEHIQTVGFGHASDFDQFIKLGFLYGERTVLWDVVGSRLLKEQHATPRLKSLLGHVACNLLLLRPVVESGGLVILPHPIVWSSLAEKVGEDLRRQKNKSAATLGLSMALAAIEEGLPLHPYTLLSSGPQPQGQVEVSVHVGDLYSPENYIFHKAITTLLRDQRVAYLKGVSASDFYQVVSQHTELQRALRKHFISDLKGLSIQQARVELDHLTDDLVSLVEKRNKAICDYVAEGSEATAALALTSITTLVGVPPLDALAMGGVALPLLGATRKWLNTPGKNVIVQAFQEFQTCDVLQQTPPLHPVVTPVTFKADPDDSICEIYKEFMSFSWTEERHKYLESLSPEVARELLRMLNSDDLEVIVNHRRFQEDYIGDYLRDLLELDEESFWEHVGKTFESPDGMLVYDHDDHIQVMCSCDMPLVVFTLMLNSLLVAHRPELEAKESEYTLDMVLEILYFQTEKATRCSEKRVALCDWVTTLTSEDREPVLWFLGHVYKEGIPDWLETSDWWRVTP